MSKACPMFKVFSWPNLVRFDKEISKAFIPSFPTAIKPRKTQFLCPSIPDPPSLLRPAPPPPPPPRVINTTNSGNNSTRSHRRYALAPQVGPFKREEKIQVFPPSFPPLRSKAPPPPSPASRERLELVEADKELHCFHHHFHLLPLLPQVSLPAADAASLHRRTHVLYTLHIL